MLKGFSALQILFWNILLILVWHMAMFIACVKLPASFFDCKKSRFQAKEWERGGRWYRDKLKINAWKDKVPQHVAKDGFSKAHLTDVSVEYLDEFIMETCRGEWFHLNNCVCGVVTMLLNPLGWDLLITFLVLLGNLPFGVIQRYNRFRLLVVRKKILRDMAASQKKHSDNRVTA